LTDAPRYSILGAVRHHLRGQAPGSAPPEPAAPGSATAPAIDRDAGVARFKAQLESVGGRCVDVEHKGALGAAIARIVTQEGARRLAFSDAALLAGARAELGARGDLDPIADPDDREALFASHLGVSTAQWGIAETGTLVLDARAERHRLVSLLPPVHVAVLPVDRLRTSAAEVLAEVAAAPDGPAHALTFVTGPSRTADIELTLVVGVHGPAALWVLLLGS